MRRILSLAVSALVVFAACSDDESATGDTTPLMSLETVPEDKCDPDYVPATTVADTAETSGTTAGFRSSATTEPPATTEATDGTDPDDTGTDDTGTDDTGTDDTGTDSTDVTETSEGEPDPYAEVPEIELPEELPTELVRTVLVDGPADGRAAKEGDLVTVYYVGVLAEDGTQFDANYGTGTPFPVANLGQAQVIAGWNEGLIGAHPGDRIQLDIPSELGYGAEGSGAAIPPGAALTFVIDVVDVVGPPEYTIPAVAPTELERTVLEAGQEDGRVAQDFDTITLNWVVVVGEPNDPDDVTETTEATDDTSTDDSGVDTTESTDTTEPADGTDVSETTEAGETSEAADTSEASDTTEASDSSEPMESTEPEAESAVGNILDSSYGVAVVELPLGQAGIEGIDNGLQGVRPGDVIQLDIPADQALGAAGSPENGVPEFSSLTVVAEIIDVTGPPLVEVPAEVPTELTVTEITPGTGTPAAVGDMVFVNFVGVLTEDGTRFQTNYGSQAYPVVLGEEDAAVIEGWQEGLVGVTTGERLQLDVPADLAYGADGSGELVPADAALSFIIDVVGIAPATDAADAPMQIELPISEDPVEGLVTDDIVEGDGATLHEGQDAVVNVYVVCGNNGALIDSSWTRDRREVIPTAQGSVIEGLRQGIIDMRVGGRRVITVPAALAMGDAGSPELGVDANQDLIFVVDLYAILGDDPTATTEVAETTEVTDTTEVTETTTES